MVKSFHPSPGTLGNNSVATTRAEVGRSFIAPPDPDLPTRILHNVGVQINFVLRNREQHGSRRKIQKLGIVRSQPGVEHVMPLQIEPARLLQAKLDQTLVHYVIAHRDLTHSRGDSTGASSRSNSLNQRISGGRLPRLVQGLRLHEQHVSETDHAIIDRVVPVLIFDYVVLAPLLEPECVARRSIASRELSSVNVFTARLVPEERGIEPRVIHKAIRCIGEELIEKPTRRLPVTVAWLNSSGSLTRTDHLCVIL